IQQRVLAVRVQVNEAAPRDGHATTILDPPMPDRLSAHPCGQLWGRLVENLHACNSMPGHLTLRSGAHATSRGQADETLLLRPLDVRAVPGQIPLSVRGAPPHQHVAGPAVR